MSSQLPAYFISHGSPMTAIDGSAAHQYLKGLGKQIPKPRNILIISAHWVTDIPVVATGEAPGMIYDFGGFPAELSALNYPAPGDPDLAEHVLGLLEGEGLTVGRDAGRGYDHGVWVPLSLIFPAAKVPICQLSLQPALGPEHSLMIGRALRILRDEGTLIIASGAMTHNLPALFGQRPERDAPAPDWVTDFTDWIADAIVTGRIGDLLNYRQLAPHAEINHPTVEHLLPLFVALGSASEPLRAERIHASQSYGVLAMDCYLMS